MKRAPGKAQPHHHSNKVIILQNTIRIAPITIIELLRKKFSSQMGPLPLAKRTNAFDQAIGMSAPLSPEFKQSDYKMNALPSPESEEDESGEHTIYSTGLEN